MNTTNGYSVIDRRAKLPCDCGCGQEATLPHFTKLESKLVLPGCVPAYKERQASQQALREIILKQRGLCGRLMQWRSVYRLQRSIFDRQGASVARRTALRSALIYLVGTRVGLWVSLCWRKS